MKKLMMLLLLSCRKATELIDKKAVTNLSLQENVQLSIHTNMCKACMAYRKQSALLDMFVHKTQTTTPTPKTLPEETKQKIIKALDKK